MTDPPPTPQPAPQDAWDVITGQQILAATEAIADALRSSEHLEAMAEYPDNPTTVHYQGEIDLAEIVTATIDAFRTTAPRSTT